MKQVTLIKGEQEWDLYLIRGALCAKDTNPHHGGFYQMFGSIKEAEEDGWKVVRQREAGS